MLHSLDLGTAWDAGEREREREREREGGREREKTLAQPRTLWQEGVTTLTCIDMLQCDRQNCAAVSTHENFKRGV